MKSFQIVEKECIANHRKLYFEFLNKKIWGNVNIPSHFEWTLLVTLKTIIYELIEIKINVGVKLSCMKISFKTY